MGENYEPNFDTELLLPKVVDGAHASNVTVSLSVGGWTGSKNFSPMVAQADRRKIFINKLVSYIKKFDLDGIDIDWEFPGRVGVSCNVVDVGKTMPKTSLFF